METTCKKLPEFRPLSEPVSFIENILGKDFDWEDLNPIHLEVDEENSTCYQVYEYFGIYVLEIDQSEGGAWVGHNNCWYWQIDHNTTWTEISLTNA
jgi:hypothetical protein